MMKLRTLVVDDEVFARRGIRALLERVEDIEILAECSDGTTAVHAIRTARPDLVYLDIEMPDMSGFDVVRTVGVESMPHVIFVTAFDEYAVRAFEVRALDYLLKPIDEQRFAIALERARRMSKEGEPHPSSFSLTRVTDLAPVTAADPGGGGFAGGYFPVRTGDRILPLRVADVYAAVAAGNYVSLQTKAKSWLVRDTLAEIEVRFARLGFVRIHRSVLINIERIAELEPLPNGEYDVVLQDGKSFRLSRSYRDAVKRIFLRDPR
jgi:two-component system, LytTR family, response regulator